MNYWEKINIILKNCYNFTFENSSRCWSHSWPPCPSSSRSFQSFLSFLWGFLSFLWGFLSFPWGFLSILWGFQSFPDLPRKLLEPLSDLQKIFAQGLSSQLSFSDELHHNKISIFYLNHLYFTYFILFKPTKTHTHTHTHTHSFSPCKKTRLPCCLSLRMLWPSFCCTEW